VIFIRKRVRVPNTSGLTCLPFDPDVIKITCVYKMTSEKLAVVVSTLLDEEADIARMQLQLLLHHRQHVPSPLPSLLSVSLFR